VRELKWVAGWRRLVSGGGVGSRTLAGAALLVGVVGGLAACGGDGGVQRSQAPSASAVRTAFRGSPASLTGLHAQADRLLSGGERAFAARLRSLRGRPVVVNKWASWCGPCQDEFPVFQQVAVADGRRVAFLGVDGQDATPAARSFLRRFPVTYPSYLDPRSAIANGPVLQAPQLFPQTVYYDASGRRVYDHAGPYQSAAALERDIRFYLQAG